MLKEEKVKHQQRLDVERTLLSKRSDVFGYVVNVYSEAKGNREVEQSEVEHARLSSELLYAKCCVGEVTDPMCLLQVLMLEVKNLSVPEEHLVTHLFF